MKAVILCGGRGTRIRDVSELIPKPMLPIGGMPILWHIMKIYSMHGIKDFILCIGYKGWVIKEFFLNYRAMQSDVMVELGSGNVTYQNGHTDDWTVTLADTGEDTMTGGRVAAIRRYVGDETFCLTYGDGIADINVSELLSQHRQSGLAATLTAVRMIGRFGELQINNNRVERFQEKPETSAPHINGGFMVLDGRRLWPYIEDRPDLVLEREPLEGLSRNGQLGVYCHEGYWQCMDTLREYEQLNTLWNSGHAPWKIW